MESKKVKSMIIQTDGLGMITLNEFDSVADASKATGVNPSSIRKVILGERETAGTFIWEKVDVVE